jgi:hypothetical protein
MQPANSAFHRQRWTRFVDRERAMFRRSLRRRASRCARYAFVAFVTRLTVVPLPRERDRSGTPALLS